MALGAALAGAIGMGGGLASSALGYIGGKKARKFAKKEAEKNRVWQEKMSNTAYQRAMADMSKAGLNPILAYKLGGASTPSGATAQSTANPEQALGEGLSAAAESAITTGMKVRRENQEVTNLKEAELEARDVRHARGYQNARTVQQTKNMQVQNKIFQEQLKRERAIGNMYETSFGKMLPYLSPAGRIGNAAKSIMPGGGAFKTFKTMKMLKRVNKGAKKK